MALIRVSYLSNLGSLTTASFEAKEALLERADFNLQLLMFVTEEKEREMFIIFFLSSFCQLLSPHFQARERQDHESSAQPA